jgi:hypothetical protein
MVMIMPKYFRDDSGGMKMYCRKKDLTDSNCIDDTMSNLNKHYKIYSVRLLGLLLSGLPTTKGRYALTSI